MAVVLGAAPASAVVMHDKTGNAVTIFGNGDDDIVTVVCQAGWLGYADASVHPCATTSELGVKGGDGADSVDLSSLQQSDFPALTYVQIVGGGGADTVTGSFLGDRIFADRFDTVVGFGGDDHVTDAGSVFGGDGDDLIEGAAAGVAAGSGNDTIVQSGVGPVDGGTGDDELVLALPTAPGLSFDIVVSDASLGLVRTDTQASVDIPAVDLETYHVTLPSLGSHSLSSAPYSGSVVVTGRRGVEVLVGGPGEDVLDGGGAADRLTGGGGFDYLRGGTGADTIDARDGEVDRVSCGEGTDTLVADVSDLVTGCETVATPAPATPPVAPPAPPPLPPGPAAASPTTPSTGLVKGPKRVEKGMTARFRFSSPTAGASFQCKLDRRRWKPCSAPHRVVTTRLRASRHGVVHRLQVRAVLGGVVDPTPTTRRFRVTR